MVHISEIYATQLGTLGHGHPLWSPEPRDDLEVQLGDVGIVNDDGAFVRLFNITCSESHKLNKHGVPHDFQPYELNRELIAIRNRYIFPGFLMSSSMSV